MTWATPFVVAAVTLLAATDPHPRDIAPAAAAPQIIDPAGFLTTPPPPEPEPERSPPAPLVAPATLPVVAPTPPGSCWERRSQCRSLSITGIVAGALGLAAIGTGVGLALQPDEPIPDMPAYLESTRPVGAVALGMGIGVVVTSMLMILAGRRAHKLGLEPARR
jgi:hypothetical protein